MCCTCCIAATVYCVDTYRMRLKGVEQKGSEQFPPLAVICVDDLLSNCHIPCVYMILIFYFQFVRKLSTWTQGFFENWNAENFSFFGQKSVFFHSTHVHLWIWMFFCMLHTFVCMYICIYLYVNMYKYVHSYLNIYKYTFVYTYKEMIFAEIRIHVFAYVNGCM